MPQLEHTHPTHTHSAAASSDKAKLSSLSDNVNMTHQHTIWESLSATSQPNYIIIPCLIVPVQLRRGRAFVWLLECGALGIFQRKGSFLEDGAKERSRGWDHGCWCPLLFFHLYHSHSIFLGLSSLSLGLCICLWISQFWTIPSLFCVRLLCIGLTNRSPQTVYSQSFPRAFIWQILLSRW